MALRPSDLADLEVALLGVLCLGLPPSKSAGDDGFRVDYVTAVVAALQTDGKRDVYLAGDGSGILKGFRTVFRGAIQSLREKGVLADQPAGMPAAAGGFEAGLQIDMVNPDEQPAVLDRYLAQECMEALFNIPAVYPYLMERYAAAGEVWRRLREDGYAR